MGIDHIRELLLGRRFSCLVLVVSDLEVPEVSVVELIVPRLLCGRIVLLIGAPPVCPLRLFIALTRWSLAAAVSRLGLISNVLPG